MISTNPADLAKKSDACVGVLEANLRGTEFVLKIPSTEEFIDAGRAEGEEQVIQLVKRRREWESLLKLKYVSFIPVVQRTMTITLFYFFKGTRSLGNEGPPTNLCDNS